MRTQIEQAAAHCDLILPSFDSAATNSGDTDPQAKIARYHRLRAVQVVVRNGGGPTVFSGPEGTGALTDLVAEQPVDTTSAGDSFNAGYLAAVLQGAGCEAASRAGHALRREVIRHRGALVPQAIVAVK